MVLPLLFFGAALGVGAAAAARNTRARKQLDRDFQREQERIRAAAEAARARQDTVREQAYRTVMRQHQDAYEKQIAVQERQLKEAERLRKQQQANYEQFRKDVRAPVETPVFRINTEVDDKGNVIKRTKAFTDDFKVKTAQMLRVSGLSLDAAEKALKKLDEPLGVKVDGEDFDPNDFTDIQKRLKDMDALAKPGIIDEISRRQLEPEFAKLDVMQQEDIDRLSYTYSQQGVQTEGNPSYEEARDRIRRNYALQKLNLRQGVQELAGNMLLKENKLLQNRLGAELTARMQAAALGRQRIDRYLKTYQATARTGLAGIGTFAQISAGGQKVNPIAPLQQPNQATAQALAQISQQDSQTARELRQSITKLLNFNVASSARESERREQELSQFRAQRLQEKSTAINNERNALRQLTTNVVQNLLQDMDLFGTKRQEQQQQQQQQSSAGVGR